VPIWGTVIEPACAPSSLGRWSILLTFSKKEYNEVLLSQARVTAACNAMHVIEARFCRWLLQSADRAGNTTVNLTQEFLAEMLGVRRTSVTEVASKIQSAGAINYARGVINILDRPALEKMSCDCYQTLLDQSVVLS
jgi:hypothetical protein